MANFNVAKDAKTVNVHLKLSLRAGVKNKSLKQSKGTGASGSFKIGELVKPTEVNKNGGKVKLYFTLERKAAVQSIVPLHSYL
jgi:hypothetical protein